MVDQLNVMGDVRPEDEPLPFLSNFQDIFLTIGLVIFLAGVSITMVLIGDDLVSDAKSAAFVVAGLSAVVLAIVWLLSQALVRKRRRILPGIVLNLTFLGLIFVIASNLYGGIYGENVLDDIENIGDRFENAEWAGQDLEDAEPTHEVLRDVAGKVRDTLPWSVKGFFLGMPVLMALAGFYYYRRFQLPFSSATFALAVIGVVLTLIFFAFPYDVFRFSPSIYFLSGLALLVAGVSFDMRDPERVTRWSGNGFWLHFFAAPMVLGGALMIASIGPAYDIPTMIEGDVEQFSNPFSVGQSIVTLIIIGIFAVISLLLNRRALVVAGLVSAGIAIGVIVRASGLGGAEVAAVTLMVLGGGILLLGLGWNAARRALLAVVPSGGFWDRVFPRVEEADG